MRPILFRAPLLLGLLTLSLAGCPQGEGDRCQVDTDCGDGLYCELAGNSRTMGGQCRKTGSSTGATLDLAAARTDMGVDLSAPQDLGPDLGDAGRD